MHWHLEHLEGDTWADVFGRRTPYSDTEWRGIAQFAGPNHNITGGANIREHWNYGASPGFNAVKWPVVTARVSLPVDRLDLRDELGQFLRDTIGRWLDEKGLSRAICARCGSLHPCGQSCGCFDNGGQ